MTARANMARLAAFLMLSLPVSIAAINAGLVAIAALLLAFHRRFDWRRIRHPLVYALGVYCLASLVCALNGTDPRHSLGAVFKDFHKLWTACLLLMALEAPDPRASLWLGAGFSLISVVGILQVATQTAGDYWARAHGFVHAVTYGQLLAAGLLGGLCLLLHEARPGRRRLIAAFAALCGLALILNQTRTVLVSAFCGFVALSAIDAKVRRRALWALPVTLLVIGAWEIMPTGGRSLRYLLESSQTMAKGRNPHTVRYELWKAAGGMFRDHPWTGIGPGTYRANFGRYFSGRLAEPAEGSAHNAYLHQLAERGILGAFALAAVLVVLVGGSWRRAKAHPGPWTYWSFATAAAFVVMNLAEVAFQNEQVATLVLFTWAAAEAEVRQYA